MVAEERSDMQEENQSSRMPSNAINRLSRRAGYRCKNLKQSNSKLNLAVLENKIIS